MFAVDRSVFLTSFASQIQRQHAKAVSKQVQGEPGFLQQNSYVFKPYVQFWRFRRTYVQAASCVGSAVQPPDLLYPSILVRLISEVSTFYTVTPCPCLVCQLPSLYTHKGHSAWQLLTRNCRACSPLRCQGLTPGSARFPLDISPAVASWFNWVRFQSSPCK